MAQGYGPRWLATRACALSWLFASLYCHPALAASWTVEGRVVGVSDGDTITVLDRAKVPHKIRLSGIDAPEKGQPFSDRAKENLSRLVFDKTVEAHCHKKDRYGREVCKVVRGATDVNLEQLNLYERGISWGRFFPNENSVQVFTSESFEDYLETRIGIPDAFVFVDNLFVNDASGLAILNRGYLGNATLLSVTSVPEPGMLGLMFCGFAAAFFARGRRHVAGRMAGSRPSSARLAGLGFARRCKLP